MEIFDKPENPIVQNESINESTLKEIIIKEIGNIEEKYNLIVKERQRLYNLYYSDFINKIRIKYNDKFCKIEKPDEEVLYCKIKIQDYTPGTNTVFYATHGGFTEKDLYIEKMKTGRIPEKYITIITKKEFDAFVDKNIAKIKTKLYNI